MSEQNPYSPPQVNADPERPPPASVYALAGPRGIGGWLVLPLLSLISTPFVVTFTTVRDFSRLLEPGVWDALSKPGSESYHPMWMPVLVIELVMNVGLVVGTVWLLVLFVRKSRRVPFLMIVWNAATLGIQVIDFGLMQLIPALAAEAHVTPELVRGAIATAIWIPYFANSVRVKNTFVN